MEWVCCFCADELRGMESNNSLNLIPFAGHKGFGSGVLPSGDRLSLRNPATEGAADLCKGGEVHIFNHISNGFQSLHGEILFSDSGQSFNVEAPMVGMRFMELRWM